MKPLILVVDDEPDVEVLFRQQFRRDLRDGRFNMDFAQSASAALDCVLNAGDASLILILSDINMLGMSGLELLPKAKAARPDHPQARWFSTPGLECSWTINHGWLAHQRLELENDLIAAHFLEHGAPPSAQFLG